MADAQIIITGGIVAEPRQRTTQSGHRVTSLTVRAGRSRREQDGTWTTLSSTAYDVSCWGEVSDMVAAQTPERGGQVTIMGDVTGTRTYEDSHGETQTMVQVRALGVHVWPRRDRQQSGQQAQQHAPSQAPYEPPF